MKVLIAEDEPMLLKMMELRLKKEGYEVLTASDGLQAIALLEAEAPDLLVTDIMMPFVSGMELVGKVLERTPRIPVIVLSAMGQENVVLEAFSLGADDYMTKPFSPNELVIRVRKLLK
jgi:DNA-binding response OmpR family regulator